MGTIDHKQKSLFWSPEHHLLFIVLSPPKITQIKSIWTKSTQNFPIFQKPIRKKNIPYISSIRSYSISKSDECSVFRNFEEVRWYDMWTKQKTKKGIPRGPFKSCGRTIPIYLIQQIHSGSTYAHGYDCIASAEALVPKAIIRDYIQRLSFLVV